ncbi:tRNA (guanine(37)-N1)-methyltransferase-like [Ornithodoros turicata]|uniref:tRNA (guanine(37)-N1)-methyltransferase-like n=1 Tax=Ornithodoros turicata TaxID=34597 RepID=UPI00313A0592
MLRRLLLLASLKVKMGDPAFSAICPPATVKGMTQLDRDAFRTVVKVPCFEVATESSNTALCAVRKYLLKLPRFKPVQDGCSSKIFVLNPDMVQRIEDMTQNVRNTLEHCGVTSLGVRDVPLHYDNWTAEVVLRAVLGQPDAVGHSIVGHIVHLNLRPHLEPFKHLIGQVYLDKVKNVGCVMNKVNTIENEFRTFHMELLAGEAKTEVSVKENGARFEFDFAEVYWNPRLSTEHCRIVSCLGAGDVLYDVFAGVGPFAIPAARRKCTVFANDLNPVSYKWLSHNVALNKVSKQVSTFNLDGREFIRTVFGSRVPEQLEQGKCIHVVMNLPSNATEFLDAFVGVLEREPAISSDTRPPIVHCYYFEKQDKEDKSARALQLVQEAVGKEVATAEMKFVRSVAPNKDMMRVTFELPLSIMANCPPAKRCKLQEVSVSQ